MSAILFASISTVADTSEMRRAAFNEACRAHGLDWSWSREGYQPLLQSSGGEQRVAGYAAERGEDVDAAAVHRTKFKLAQGRMVAGSPLVSASSRRSRRLRAPATSSRW